jgi:homopolymeric O-antigen transport system ATP-binding protein
MTPAIRVDNLGKCYRVAHNQERARYRTFRDTIVDAVKAPFRRLMNQGQTAAAEDFWALKDVSFEVQPGEVVGIIGRNGAGKSTLLKVLSRITKPSKGRVELNGRVGSLLEVGTGFHPELSGRENIYLNGSILGMSQREIARKFDEIVAFAEIEKFLDTPVKRYSSGMYVRLAFAVAAHLEPEILIVDEVLAVGDLAFQKKCFGKMSEVGQSGKAVLFVSHDLGAITRLTKRSVLLDQGLISQDGRTPQVVTHYLSDGVGFEAEWHAERESTSGIRIASVCVRDEGGRIKSRFQSDEQIIVDIGIKAHNAAQAQVAFRLNSATDGETVFTTAMSDQDFARESQVGVGQFSATCTIPANFLRPAEYCLLVAINNFRGPKFDMLERVLRFEVTPVGSLITFDNRLGAVTPLLRWKCNEVVPQELNVNKC